MKNAEPLTILRRAQASPRQPSRTSERSPAGAFGGVFADASDHALVQERLAVFYGTLGSLVLALWIIPAAIVAVAIPAYFWEIHLSTSKLLHLVIAVGLVLGARLTRRAPLSRPILSALDLGAALAVTTTVAFIVALAPRAVRSEFVGAMGFTLAACLRAALVPSPPRWTALVVGIAAIPVPIGSMVGMYREITWSPDEVPRSAIFAVLVLWCAAIVVAAAVVARVVYGLRTEVKNAMRLGQYTLEEKIGEGGMGVVYRARHALLRRPTAVKLLSPSRADAVDIQRFEREVQATSALTHPNTIAIYDYGHTPDGVFYYAMELLDGISLQELVERHGAQPAARVVHIGIQIARALAEAHDAGLVHRDVKPANVVLCQRGGLADVVKVLDFGLVKELGSTDTALSNANVIAGTPLYMAPETIQKPDAVDARVDLYALGGVFFFLLTGAPVFSGANLVEVCSNHLHVAPRAPSSLTATVPPALDALVLACLAKAPADRPASARVVATQLERLARELPWDEEAAAGWWRTFRQSRTRDGDRARAED